MMTKTHNLSDYVTSLSLGSVLLMIGAAVYAAPPNPRPACSKTATSRPT